MPDTSDDPTKGFPPEVTVSKERTHCEACGEQLKPDVKHVCSGNRRFHEPEDPRNTAGFGKRWS